MAKQCFGEGLDKSKVLKYDYNRVNQGDDVNLIMAWLDQPADGPRLCEANLYMNEIFEQILQAVRQVF